MRILTFIIVASLFAACGGNNSAADAAAGTFSPSQLAEQTKAFEGMMAAHDRVMPQIGQIAQLQKGIITKLETEKMDEETAVTLKETYSLLEKSHDGMMEWMKSGMNLDELRATMDHQSILDFAAKKNTQMAEVESMLAKGLMLAKQHLGDALPSAHDHSGHEGHNH